MPVYKKTIREMRIYGEETLSERVKVHANCRERLLEKLFGVATSQHITVMVIDWAA